MSPSVPHALLARADDPAWAEWLSRLPRLADDLLTEWQLSPDGDPFAATSALILPVRTREAVPAALKIGRPEVGGTTAHLALRYWDGHGSVRLLRADPRRAALLLERADPSRDLAEVPVEDAIEIVASLYPALHRSAPPRVRRLAELAAGWAEVLPRLVADGRVPRRLVEHATALARDAAPGASSEVLLHGDLHYGTVLGSLRDDDPAGWLAVGAQPLAGDPAWEATSLLRARLDEVRPDRLRGEIAGRLWVLSSATGWDEERMRDWAILREVAALNAFVDAGALTPRRLERGILTAKALER